MLALGELSDSKTSTWAAASRKAHPLWALQALGQRITSTSVKGTFNLPRKEWRLDNTPKQDVRQVCLIPCWARMRAFALILALGLVGCGRPGIDELPHAKPNQAERSLAEANWDKLERALQAKDLAGARSLIGKPIVFFADVDDRGSRVSGRRCRTFSDAEQAELSKLPPPEQSERLIKRIEALPKIPCCWEFTRLQKRTIRSCCSVGLEVFGTLSSVSSNGVEVAPQDFGFMLCL
jgi:hypothetical protein